MGSRGVGGGKGGEGVKLWRREKKDLRLCRSHCGSV